MSPQRPSRKPPLKPKPNKGEITVIYWENVAKSGILLFSNLHACDTLKHKNV